MNETYRKRLVEQIKKEQMDAMLIVPSEELMQLIGIRPILFERFQGLFVKSDGDYFYFCNLLSGDEIKDTLGDEKVITWFDNEHFTDILEKTLTKENLIGKKIGLNATARAFNIKRIEAAMDIEFVDGKEIIEKLNMIKSQEELNGLREASRIADKVMNAAINFIEPGQTEREIVEFIESEFIKYGSTPDFAIVASGSNSALPHYMGGKRIIMNQDIVLMDIGGKFNGFSSDITRTVFVGEPTEMMKEVYALVLKANLSGESVSLLGSPVAQIDFAARKVIADGGYGQYFTTRVGHGIGYSTHEEPYINQLSNKVLVKGMAFTVEPGIYLRGQFGVRIEDTVIMTEQGIEILNQVNKDLIILKANKTNI